MTGPLVGYCDPLTVRPGQRVRFMSGSGAGEPDYEATFTRLVKEEFLYILPHAPDDPDIRADITFFETPSGGGVFSTGSIAWAGSLAHKNHDNNASRLTGNVLRRCTGPTPFEFPPP